VTLSTTLTDELRLRSQALKQVIADAERKKVGITAAIESRKKTLQRLQAQLALTECGPAPACDGK
jgi:hypothetical protein